MMQISVSKGWLHIHGGFTFPREYYFDPLKKREQDQDIDSFLRNRFPDLPVYNVESNLVQTEYTSEHMICVGAIQPNLILGTLLGAEMFFPEGADPDIYGAPLSDIKSISDLPPADTLIFNPLIKEFDAQLILLGKQFPNAAVIPPFFWDSSGRATIHGFITTAYKLIGQRIFLMLSDQEKLVQAVHTWIFEAYRVLIEHFSHTAHLPVSSLHIGECSGSLVSLNDFNKFITPHVNRAANFQKIRFHTCGNSDHLLPALTRLKNLLSLDTGSGTSISGIRSAMGGNFLIETSPPVEILLEGSPVEGCRDWITEVLNENAGGPLRIGCHLEPGYDISHLAVIQETLALSGR